MRAHACCQSDRWSISEDYARPCGSHASLARDTTHDLKQFWTNTQGNLDGTTESFRARSVMLRSLTLRIEKQS